MTVKHIEKEKANETSPLPLSSCCESLCLLGNMVQGSGPNNNKDLFLGRRDHGELSREVPSFSHAHSRDGSVMLQPIYG